MQMILKKYKSHRRVPDTMCSDLALKTQQCVDWRQKATLLFLITVQSNNSN